MINTFGKPYKWTLIILLLNYDTCGKRSKTNEIRKFKQYHKLEMCYSNFQLLFGCSIPMYSHGERKNVFKQKLQSVGPRQSTIVV